MAIVYKAYDTRLEREVAVKVIRMGRLAPDLADKTRKRFDREAKALAKLNHPNIVQVIDFGEYEGVPYLVMPYLPGGTIKQIIKKGRITWGEAVDMLAPIARALEYAHRLNIVHRDIKPANILISETGAPMLSDFGVAKVLSDSDETHELTGTGMGVGTPEYMAPEQFHGQADSRADIYALGVVLYEMVTGRKPYIAETPAAVIIKQATEPLPRPNRFAPDLPASIEKILIKSLAKAPKDRYQNMGEFALALERLILVGEKENKKREEQQKKDELQKKRRQERENRKQEEQKQKKALKQKKEAEKEKKREKQKAKQADQKKARVLQQKEESKAKLKKPEERSQKKGKSSIPLKPVLWGIIGIIGLGLIYGLVNGIGHLNMTLPSSISTLTDTSVPVSSTSTSSPVANPTPQYTSTPIKTPTQIMSPTPSPTAMPDGWLYFDDFEGNKRQYSLPRNGASTGITQIDNSNVFFVSDVDKFGFAMIEFIELSGRSKLRNYAVEFDLLFSESPENNDLSWLAVCLRRTFANCYDFVWFAGNNTFSIDYIPPGHAGSGDWGQREGLTNPGNYYSRGETWYHIRAEAKDDQLTFSIESPFDIKRTIQAQDTRVSVGAPVLIVDTGLNVTVYFDNILVESLE